MIIPRGQGLRGIFCFRGFMVIKNGISCLPAADKSDSAPEVKIPKAPGFYQ